MAEASPDVDHAGYPAIHVRLMPEAARTFGEMSAEEKHSWTPGQGEGLSHRARAFAKFAEACLG